MEFTLIDIETSQLTFGEVMRRIGEFKKDPKYSCYDVFMDGDKHAIVARLRE